MLSLVICPKVTDKSKQSERTSESKAEEFLELSKAIDIITVESVANLKVNKIHAGTYFGSGKILEFKSIIDSRKIELVLIDTKLSPMQQRNLEKELKVKILDRTGLILEIFGDRARTREGVLQVDLAHLEYQRTRLVRSWTHLERQRGGIGFMGGPGETQIESDRRGIAEKIYRIKKLLDKVISTRRLHRSNRKKNDIPIIALVGYTNAGKSSIFNYLTNSNELEKDMLFATLDPKMSVFNLAGSEKVILLDTVGFISDLPTHLISAFRATLEEVINANLILHIRDIAHQESQQQAIDVENTLERLEWGLSKRPQVIEVYNKIDKLSELRLRELRASVGNSQEAILLSALKGIGFEYLQNKIVQVLSDGKNFEEVFLEFSESKRRSWLFNNKLITNEKIVDEGFLLKVCWSKQQKSQFFKV
jgi:GTP-binding protein HflX